jgi:hypothetical protein
MGVCFPAMHVRYALASSSYGLDIRRQLVANMTESNDSVV